MIVDQATDRPVVADSDCRNFSAAHVIDRDREEDVIRGPILIFYEHAYPEC
jgi:hypothetical protein